MQKQLQATGRVALRGVGDFSSNIKGEIVFTPYCDYILTPSYYGLENFSIAPLSTPNLVEFVPHTTSFHKSMAGFAVAAIVFLTLLFTSILPDDDNNKTGRASSSTFTALSAEQMQKQRNRRDYTPHKVSEVKASDIVAQPSTSSTTAHNTSTNVPAANPTTSNNTASTQAITNPSNISTPSVPASTGVSNATPSASKSVGGTSITKNKSYYIIAASLSTKASAKPYLSDFKARGFRDATIVEGKGRYRIAIAQFDNRQNAESKISDLRKDPQYKDVWLLIQ